MRRRHPPRLWLMTDERQGDRLWDALAQLPRGSGIVFRHYRLPQPERRALFERVRRIARRRGLVLLLAGPPAQATVWGADGSHGRGPKAGKGLRTAPAHDLAEIRSAERRGADLLFVSPVFATRSHPGARTLGPLRLGLLARQARRPVVALGGMDVAAARRLCALDIHGWAAIDGWSPSGQKRKAVPI